VRVRIVQEAETEAAEAAEWYEERRQGLGIDFLDAFSRALEAIEQHPRRYLRISVRPTHREVRRILLKRFPYKVIFEIRSDEVLVLAVAHVRRHPTYWRRRNGPSST
jgi:hypothetical protein